MTQAPAGWYPDPALPGRGLAHAVVGRDSSGSRVHDPRSGRCRRAYPSSGPKARPTYARADQRQAPTGATRAAADLVDGAVRVVVAGAHRGGRRIPSRSREPLDADPATLAVGPHRHLEPADRPGALPLSTDRPLLPLGSSSVPRAWRSARSTRSPSGAGSRPPRASSCWACGSGGGSPRTSLERDLARSASYLALASPAGPVRRLWHRAGPAAGLPVAAVGRPRTGAARQGRRHQRRRRCRQGCRRRRSRLSRDHTTEAGLPPRW